MSTKISTGQSSASHEAKLAGEFLQIGDTVCVSMGKETFGDFDVGPVLVMVRVREPETPADVYARARRIASIMFDAEFETKKFEFYQRKARAKE